MRKLLSALLIVAAGAVIGVGYAVMTPTEVKALPCDCLCGAVYAGYAASCASGCGAWTDTICLNNGHPTCGPICNTNHTLLGCLEPGEC